MEDLGVNLNPFGNNSATTATTEWDDAQRRLGNLAPLEVGIEEDTFENWVVSEAEKKLSHENDSIDQLDEKIDNADDDDDESELQKIR